jgi:hypothetical protein
MDFEIGSGGTDTEGGNFLELSDDQELLDDFSGVFDYDQDLPQNDSQQQVPQNNPGQTEIWNNKCVASIHSLQTIVNRFVALVEHFGVKAARYSAKKSALNYLIIFPWFRFDTRYRQTLKLNPAEGPTIGTVVDAINYFLSRESYSQPELNFLSAYYRDHGCPELSHCFTSIIELKLAFQQEFPENPALPPPPPLAPPPPPADLTDQMNRLQIRTVENENEIHRLDQNQQWIIGRINQISAPSSPASPASPEMNSKRRRTDSDQRGDRATYYRIRKADQKTKNRWYLPGGVFGLYSDGVGPLRPVGRCRLVVYSILPDTEEPHPDLAHPEKYARVVMVRPSFHPPPPLPLLFPHPDVMVMAGG